MSSVGYLINSDSLHGPYQAGCILSSIMPLFHGQYRLELRQCYDM